MERREPQPQTTLVEPRGAMWEGIEDDAGVCIDVVRQSWNFV